LKHCSACCLLHAAFLFGLLFNPEDGGDMLLQNASWIAPEYTTLHSRKDIFSNVLICCLFNDTAVEGKGRGLFTHF
jgi:hypothetical protein